MKVFEKYIQSLQKFDINEVTEHTYRKELQELLESISDESMADITIQHEPKRQEGFGAPDFKIKTKGEAILGYVENKKLTDNLAKTLKTEQLKKYQTLSNNIILTNYLEWVWIKNGEVIDKAALCKISDLENPITARVEPSKANAVRTLISNFYSQAPKGIGKPKKLAEALAIRARYLRDFLNIELDRQEKEHQEGRLYGLYDTFKTNVFQELNKKEFADAFSQTLVYGLFLSKLNADTKTIDLYNAKQNILPAFGLISELVDFLDVLHNEHYKDARWIIEEILSVMNTLNIGSIARNLSYEKFKTTNLFDEEKISYKDPYIYFYEHFLAAYDKKLRKAKGVYYTPPQVVSFIVRSINDILKETFGIENGYADKDKVTVLDFATGTGSFLLEILNIIFDELPKGSGKKNLLIRDHILKNFYGFEYMIAPYAVANLKLSQFLKEHGYDLEDDDRFQIYLTNTLEPVDPQIKMPLLPTLTKESKAAQKVKDNPILVITGNPPYAGHSKNPSDKTKTVYTKKGKRVKRKVKTWIGERIETYKLLDGKPLGEKNPKWLQDDYVKFIRFAQWKMDQVDEGVVGIITNHRFISNPTFRGMRQSLMNTFNQIHILDLHGSNKPKEYAPDGGPDENVFDIIQQGVSISLFIKKPGLERKIVHADLFGKRIEKYDYCLNESISSIVWSELKPESPYYLLFKTDKTAKASYNKGFNLLDIFAEYKLGVATHRDFFLVDSSEKELTNRISDFRSCMTPQQVTEKFGLKDTRDWKISAALESIKKEKTIIENYQYRPFDIRKLCYNQGLYDRGCSRHNLMRNFSEGENIGLVVGRAGKNVGGPDWNLVYCTSNITDLNLFYRGGAGTFPLYIYKEPEDDKTNGQITAFESEASEQKKPNISEQFVQFANNLYGKTTPQETLGYVYAVLHSPTYREKYRSFLDIDFPKILFSEDKKTFTALSELGWEIINAHLTKKVPAKSKYPFGDFKGKGDNTVERRDFIESTDEPGIGNLHINKTQYFDNIPTTVYKFYIGGYQVLDKYLKDRRNTQLLLEEVENIEKIIRVLRYTEEKMNEIDEITKDWI